MYRKYEKHKERKREETDQRKKAYEDNSNYWVVGATNERAGVYY